VALIEDRTVTPLSFPADTPAFDVVALTHAPQAGYFALDSRWGVFALDLETRRATRRAAQAWEGTERPLSLAVDAQGRLAVGTSRGIILYPAASGAAPQRLALPRTGFVWRLRFQPGGVLEAGTDEGLFRVALDTEAVPARTDAAGPLPRDVWPVLESSCRGVEGCVCALREDCSPGYGCDCSAGEDACRCVAEDRCLSFPGTEGCKCEEDGTCALGYSCRREDDTCQQWAEPCTLEGGCSACTTHADCPTGAYCNSAEGACRVRLACHEACTCNLEKGCSPGLVCEVGAVGRR
jgi:hypothetical protein